MSNMAMKRKTAGWTTVALGDVAINSTVATQTPEEDGFTRYIIGKHIPGDGGKITTWGDVGDGEFGSRIRTVIKPGDIVCTTRGPKLRVAVATFDCLSAHTNFVLRTSDAGVVLQEYLQALACSDSFQEHLRRNFRGSTNLFVNWSDAAKFEFVLPPIEEQQRLVLALQSAERAHEFLLRASTAATIVLDSWIETRLREHAWPEHSAVDVLDRATVGIVVKPAALYVTNGGGVPALRSLNVKPHTIVMDDCVAISQEGHAAHAKSKLLPGDVVVVRSGRPGDAAVVPDSCGEMNCIDLIIATPSKRLRPHFLCAVLNSAYGRRQFASGTAGTAQQHFNVEVFKKLRLPVPDLAVQDEFVLTMAAMRVANAVLERRRQQLQAVRALLLARSVAE